MTLADETLFEERTNVPPGWVQTSLHEVVADALIGLVRAKEYQNTYGNGVPYVKMNNVTIDGKVILDDLVYVEVSSEESQRYGLCQGDILFNTRNSSELVGKTGLVRSVAVNPVYNNNLMRIRTASGVSPEFLSYQMCSQGFRGSLAKVKRATTNVAAIYARDLMPLRILLPPTEEQLRIVSKIEELFTELDSAVESLKRVQAQLKRYRQSVLKHAVEGKLTAEWREQHKDQIEPADKLLKRILAERRAKWEERELAKMKAKGKVPKDQSWKKKYKEPEPPNTEGLPELPEGWVWASVLQLATKVTDGVHKTPAYQPTGIPFISVNNMSERGTIDFTGCKFISEEEHQDLYRHCDPEPGDVLLSKVGTVGLTSVVKTVSPFSLFVNAALIKPVYGFVLPEYLSLMIRHGFASRLYKPYVTGSTQQFIGTAKIGQLPIMLPPLEEQLEISNEFAKLLSIAEEMNSSLMAGLRRSYILKQALLRTAFSGKLVPQDPNDEPASVFLEQLCADRRKNDEESKNLQRLRRKSPGT